MAEQVTLDSTLIDASNSQVVLDDDANGIRLISHDYPDPGPTYMGASSADTEGTVPIQNQLQDRTITVVARCFGSSTMRARVKALQQKAGKLNREGGTVSRTLTDGTVIHFDVLSVKCVVPADWTFANRTDVMVTLELLCKPEGYGAEQTVTAVSETSLPCLVYTVTGVKGDQPALGRLVVTEIQNVDQWQVEYGLQSRYYPGTATASTTAALFYEAESRLLYGGAAGTAVSGASGGTIVAGTVTTNYQALVSTASSGTVHATHIGDFRVKARVYCPANAGTVSYALQWGVGDLHAFTVNDAVTYDPTAAATFRHVDLGLVHIPKVATGSQRWEGRVLAKSTTANDRAGVDGLYLFPVTEGYGVASGVAQYEVPTVFAARDIFTEPAGSLSGGTATTGGTWATAQPSGGGAATDFATTGTSVTRNAGNDGNTGVNKGRVAVLGSTSYAAVAAEVDVSWSSAPSSNTRRDNLGLVLRYVDTSNHLYAAFNPQPNSAAGKLFIGTNVAGVYTELAAQYVTLAPGTTYTIRALVTATGTVSVWYYPTSVGVPNGPLVASATTLATGGVLASGKVGIWDRAITNSITQTYNNFRAFTPTTDAAMFASRTLEIRHNQAIRQDSAGSYYQSVSDFEGNYLKVPCAGAEGRSARFIVKGLRNDTDSPDTAIDDITAQLFYTPRWSTVPET